MMTNETNSTDADEPSASFSANSASNRRLKSFPGPDLEVVVGESQRIYRHNAFTLASYSAYIGTMLSSPMREKDTKHISFPDIEPETWEKMIQFLEPATSPFLESGSFTEVVLELLPLYDKYQFEDGLKLCDKIGAKLIFNDDNFHRLSDEEVAVAVLSFDLDLPLCKSKAIEYASSALGDCLGAWTKADHVRKLLPLVENKDDVLLKLVTVLKGRSSRGMNLEEIRAVTKVETFPEQCVERMQQIQDIEEVMSFSSPESMSLFVGDHDSLSALNGTYTLGFDRKHRGLLKVTYYHQSRYSQAESRGIVEPMDIYGNMWEISVLEGRQGNEESDGQEGEDTMRRKVLFRWDSGCFSSICPPKVGWKPVDPELPVDSTARLNYTLDGKRKYF